MKYLSEWHSYFEAVNAEEENYSKLIINKYNDLFSSTSTALKLKLIYLGFELAIERETYQFYTYDNGRINLTFKFNNPIASNYNLAELAIIKLSSRIVFHIVVKSNEFLFIPKLSKSALRPQPKNSDEASVFIKKIIQEIEFLSQKKEQFENEEFFFSIYREENNTPDIFKMTNYSSFEELLINALIIEEILK